MIRVVLFVMISLFDTLETKVFDLRLESFEINQEKFNVRDGVLLTFKVANYDSEKIPNNAFRMEVKINNKLTSLDNLPDAIDIGGSIEYTKEKGKFHYFVAPNDKEVKIEIEITPKNGYKFKFDSHTKMEYVFEVIK